MLQEQGGERSSEKKGTDLLELLSDRIELWLKLVRSELEARRRKRELLDSLGLMGTVSLEAERGLSLEAEPSTDRSDMSLFFVDSALAKLAAVGLQRRVSKRAGEGSRATCKRMKESCRMSSE